MYVCELVAELTEARVTSSVKVLYVHISHIHAMHVDVVHVCIHLLGSCDLKRREVVAVLGPLAACTRRSRLSAALAQPRERRTYLLTDLLTTAPTTLLTCFLPAYFRYVLPTYLLICLPVGLLICLPVGRARPRAP